MKKYSFFAAVAVAAIAVSCNKIEQPANESVFTTTFTGQLSEQTKTYLDPETFQVKFNTNDAFMTAAIQGQTVSSKTIKVTSKDGEEPVIFQEAQYTGLSESTETMYFAGTYITSGYPSPANLANKGTTDYKVYANQKITAKGPVAVDSDSDVAGKPLVNLFSIETYSAPQSSVDLKFHHITAYGNLKVENLALPEEDKVTGVKITSTTRYFATKMTISKDGSVKVGSNNISKELILDVSEMNITSGNFNVVFVTSPVDVSDTTTKITITTQGGKTFEKSVKAKTGKGNFQIGHILPFKVDFTGVEAK